MQIPRLAGIRLLIVDIDGVLCCNDAAVEGACEAVSALRDCGIGVRLLTNDCTNSRASRAREMMTMGFDIKESDIYTAGTLTASYLRGVQKLRILPMFSGSSIEDFQGFDFVEVDPDAVVVGDFFSTYDFQSLNRAFKAIAAGVPFLAMQRNRYSSAGTGATIDVGFWIAGLEYCTGKLAQLVGKPAIASYRIVCSEFGVDPKDAAMVSDDLLSDLRGASDAGLTTIHVTDYSVQIGSDIPIVPDFRVSSMRELAQLYAPS